MKIRTINAEVRLDLGTQKSRGLVRSGLVPAILYGGKGAMMAPIACTVRAMSLKELGADPCFIDLKIGKNTHRCILQEKQVHPVSNNLIHVDFLQIAEKHAITMNIPIKLVGQSIGVENGGVLIKKIRKVKVKAMPKSMPPHIPVNVSALDLGRTVKVGEVETGDFIICNSIFAPLAMVEIPRALRSNKDKEDTDATNAS